MRRGEGDGLSGMIRSPADPGPAIKYLFELEGDLTR